MYGVSILLIAIVGVGYAGLRAEQGSSDAVNDFTRNSNFIYTLAPGKETHGSAYTIPAALADGTNLAHDSYISYEESTSTACTPKDFLDGVTVVQEVTDDGVAYLVGHSVGAGAGNRYDETVYVFKNYTPCNAVRYYIHYGVLENYEPGAVKAFDRAALVAQFDTIRRTLARSR